MIDERLRLRVESRREEEPELDDLRLGEEDEEVVEAACETTYCVAGPFVGFRFSKDNGTTWTEPRMKMSSASDNVFGENGKNNGKIKLFKCPSTKL